MHRGAVRRPPIPEEMYNNVPEPDPDYLDDDEDNARDDDGMSDLPPPPPPITADELSAAVSAAYESSTANDVPVSVDGSEPGTQGSESQAGLIPPRPLHNPCAESRERQALHKELLLNQKLGKDVLQKSELNKVLRERKATQRKKEWEEHKMSKGRTSLEMKLEERANRMKEEEQKEMNVIKEEEQAPELVRMHRKITHKPVKNTACES